MATEFMEKSSATVDDVLREVSRFKGMVTEAVEEGVESAMKAFEHGRDAAEDAIVDARRAIKRNPLQAAGIIFAAGIVMGTLVAWTTSRRR
ncbi:MAG TPA: hypothetical protein VGI45_16250 [Terracidiphilus sp.]|jgi:ElaB/YqjD/DUF883 family membrane-anchored ribosome-binding protein